MRKYSNGVYSMANSGILRPLDQRRVKMALGIGSNAGAPPKMQGGARHNVYLDAESIDIALELGDGNISRGIRLALRIRADADCVELPSRRPPRPRRGADKKREPGQTGAPACGNDDQPYCRAKSCMKFTRDFTPSIGIAL
ncbi:Uncharacterised protein [Chromobacterium violaceum]|uniref:Uncharacterized protein n=1 Tax=Chromobacterium violaceum TaxID=536 RepID=A0A3S4J103_CHRVL|nr:Uncharacterised protein [Chromobacterium violaceum]